MPKGKVEKEKVEQPEPVAPTPVPTDVIIRKTDLVG